MESNQVHRQTLVSELLAACPAAVPVFLKHGMACVGCSMAIFETLEGAAQVYRLPVDEFLAEIQHILGNQASQE